MPLPPRKLHSQAASCLRTVLLVLSGSLEQNRAADRLLSQELRHHPEFGSRDRRFISETVFAVLRWWGWLRPLAPADFSPSPAWERLLAAACLLEQGTLPEGATPWLAACRLSPRQLERLAEAPESLERMRRLAAYWERPELPAWETLVPEWCRRETAYPGDFEELVRQLQRRPPIWLRPQTRDLPALLAEFKAAGLQAQLFSPAFPAIRLNNARVNLRTLPAFQEGRFEIQDLSSQVIGHVCAAKAGQRWWDACAGAGGKSLQLAWQMEGKGSLIATDLREYKLDDMRKRARRVQLSNIRGKLWSDTQPPPSKTPFDGVLVDAPCTCSGTWRRNPDARWSLRETEVAELAGLQLRILESACRGVASGGRLVYATCSLFERENQGVVAEFLRRHPEFVLEPFANPLNGQPTDGRLQVWPADGDGDAMFVARFRR